MQVFRIPAVRRRLALALLLGATAPAALAQYPSGATVQQLPRSDDPAELLATALRTLAVDPSNLAALIAAGDNALILGDPNAAVGFLGRASEVAPRDGRVKAGLGSALVQLEKPQDALRLFGEASALGVPEADIAADRGLAYDLTGDPKRAQHDYQVALAAHPGDDDVRRRLALSEGISGDRKTAIATLDPLIRKRDIAGWRAQTFVLAMTGDSKGAGEITHIMLPSQADKLQPFLARLASLSPADKARAVHFGEMPASGRAYTPTELANTGAPATYAAAPAPAPSPMQRAPTRVASVQPSDLAPARRTETFPVAPRTTAAPQPVPETKPATVMVTRAGAASTPAATVPAAAPPQSRSTPNRRYAAEPSDPLEAWALGHPVVGGLATPARGASINVAPTTVPTSVPQQPAVTRAVVGPPVQIAQTTAPAPTLAATPAMTTALPPSSPPASDVLASAADDGIPMPGATPGGVGHFDLPHDAATRSGRSTLARSRPIVATPTVTQSATVATKVEPQPTPVEPKPVEAKVAAPKPAEAPPVEPRPADLASVPAAVVPEPQPAEVKPIEKTPEPNIPEPEPAEPKAVEPMPAAPKLADLPAPKVAEAAPKPMPAKSAATKRALDRAEPDAVKPRIGKTDADVGDDSAKAKAGVRSRKSKPADADARDTAAALGDTDEAGSKSTRGKPGSKASKSDSAAASRDDGDTGTKSAHSKKGRGDSAEDTARSSKSLSSKKGAKGHADDSDGSGDSAKSNKSSKSEKSGKAAKAEKGEPERVFVQVAGGANRADMDKAWDGVRKKAPDLMNGKTASTTPLKATNRLLVGPFKSDDDAQAFVNKMAGKGVSGFVFKSAKGQKVDKVDPGQ